MLRIIIILIVFLISVKPVLSQKQKRAVFTDSKPYETVISEFARLDNASDLISLTTSGMTDSGKPLHVCVVSADKTLTPGAAKQKDKVVIMINNAIHPGEPDGVEASVQLLNSIVTGEWKLPEQVVLVIIPVYNVDGYINRGSHSRANQNGPTEYGFRGNARNLDLNRDFIKADAQNTISFEQIFQNWKPDILIDNHVSDGADYQYTMTLIATQRNKIHPVMGEYMDKSLVPWIYYDMNAMKNPICPYVETMGETPESGIAGFLETARFATGYAALFNCIGFVPETHMLKPYNDRVWATYDLMKVIIGRAGADAKNLRAAKKAADQAVMTQKVFALSWDLDTTKYDLIDFNGFEATHIISKVSGLPVLHYDRSKPYSKKIRFYNTYNSGVTVTKPDCYIIPQAWTEVVYRLRINGVRLRRLVRDTLIEPDFYRVVSVKHPGGPYEGHYAHRGTKVKTERQKVQFHAGDFVVETNQTCNRYIVETLEPQGDDSFFAWNFFDGILNQKEWFSDYVFDGKAAEIIKEDPSIGRELDSARIADTVLANSHWLQMNFIYQRSLYKEPSHNRYPVARLTGLVKLPME